MARQLCSPCIRIQSCLLSAAELDHQQLCEAHPRPRPLERNMFLCQHQGDRGISRQEPLQRWEPPVLYRLAMLIDRSQVCRGSSTVARFIPGRYQWRLRPVMAFVLVRTAMPAIPVKLQSATRGGVIENVLVQPQSNQRRGLFRQLPPWPPVDSASGHCP